MMLDEREVGTTEIQTTSYVYAGETVIPVHELEEGQRRQLATWLKERYLSALFQGQAEIQSEEDLTNC